MCDVKTYAKWWQGASRGESVRVVVMVIERPTCSLAGQQINIITEMKYNYYMDVLLLASATYFSLILSLYVLAHILHRG